MKQNTSINSKIEAEFGFIFGSQKAAQETCHFESLKRHFNFFYTTLHLIGKCMVNNKRNQLKNS